MFGPKIKLKELYLSNAQSIVGDIAIRLDGVAVLVGPNSVGKSAITEAFNLLSEMHKRDFSRRLEQQFGSQAEIGIRFEYDNDQTYDETIVEEDAFRIRKQFLGHCITLKISCEELKFEVDGKHGYRFHPNGPDDGLYSVFKYLLDDDQLLDEFGGWDLWEEDFPYPSLRIEMDESFYDQYIGQQNPDFEYADEIPQITSKSNILSKGQTKYSQGKLIFKVSDLMGDRMIIDRDIIPSINWESEPDSDLSDEFLNFSKELIDRKYTGDSRKKTLFYEQILDESNRIKNIREVNILAEHSIEVARFCKRIGSEFALLLKETLPGVSNHVISSRSIIDSTKPVVSIYPSQLGSPQLSKFIDSVKSHDSYEVDLNLELDRTISHYCAQLLVETVDTNFSYYSHSISVYHKDHLPASQLERWITAYLPSIDQQKIRPLITSTNMVFSNESEAELFNSQSFSEANSSEMHVIKDASKPFKYDVFLKIRSRDNRYQDFSEVGSGYSFIFPILTSLLLSRLSCVEQPELHLHPKLQGELADFIIAASKSNRFSVLETHSEHILLRLLRRIRDTSSGKKLKKEIRFKADNLHIYFFEPRRKGTYVKKIRVDDDGEFLNIWPGGFFQEREVDLF